MSMQVRIEGFGHQVLNLVILSGSGCLPLRSPAGHQVAQLTLAVCFDVHPAPNSYGAMTFPKKTSSLRGLMLASHSWTRFCPVMEIRMEQAPFYLTLGELGMKDLPQGLIYSNVHQYTTIQACYNMP